MESLTLLFAGLLAVSALLAGIAVRSGISLKMRVGAVALTGLFIPLTYLALNELRSQPKPVGSEYLQKSKTDAELLGFSLDEDKAIYLWLRLPDTPEPRYYVLPWRTRDAEQLQELTRLALREGGTVRIKTPFAQRRGGGELNLEFVKPPALPEKPLRTPEPTYDPRDRKI